MLFAFLNVFCDCTHPRPKKVEQKKQKREGVDMKKPMVLEMIENKDPGTLNMLLTPPPPPPTHPVEKQPSITTDITKSDSCDTISALDEPVVLDVDDEKHYASDTKETQQHV